MTYDELLEHIADYLRADGEFHALLHQRLGAADDTDDVEDGLISQISEDVAANITHPDQAHAEARRLIRALMRAEAE